MDRNDFLILIGGLIAAIGVGLIHLPSGVIVLGLELIALGYINAAVSARSQK